MVVFVSKIEKAFDDAQRVLVERKIIIEISPFFSKQKNKPHIFSLK